MFDIKELVVKKEEEESLSHSLTPDFYAIFHALWFFNPNEDIANDNWLLKFRNDGVYRSLSW